jgi:MFS family permease
MKNRSILIALTLATFVMVVDTTLLNVSLSTLAEEFNTTIQSIQGAITLYALVMAAFMIPGARLADIIGHKRAYRLGLVLYGIGSLITAFSPTFNIFLLGWSVIEGLGAAILTPVINVLITANFKGKDRASAFGVMGGMAAGGAAVGPILGGILTTYASWRYAFLGETLIVVYILYASKALIDKRLKNPPSLDVFGTILNALGMGIIIFGILQASNWGLIFATANAPFSVGPFSPVLLSIVAGIGIYALFGWYQNYRVRKKKDPLIHIDIFKNLAFISSLTMTLFQSMIQSGVFIVIPIFTQVYLGLTAFQTGVALLPVSIFLFIAAISGGKMAQKMLPKRIIQYGMVGMLVGSLLLLGGIRLDAKVINLVPGLAVLGAGIGLLISQVINVILSTVGKKEKPEAAGIQSTLDRFGYSLGTALVGVIMIVGLYTSFSTQVAQSETIPDEAKPQIEQALADNVTFVSTEYIEEQLEGAPEEFVQEITEINETATIKALDASMLFIAFVALLGLIFSRRLPAKKLV